MNHLTAMYRKPTKPYAIHASGANERPAIAPWIPFRDGAVWFVINQDTGEVAEYPFGDPDQAARYSEILNHREQEDYQ